MSGYIAQRTGLMAITVLGMSLLIFCITRVIPGDPARVAAGVDATPSMIESLRAEMGLDKPLYQQYFLYMGALLRGDFGKSFITKRPVFDDLRDFFPATLELSLYAMAASILISIPLGLVSASHQGQSLDSWSRLIATTGAAMPIFWLGNLSSTSSSAGFRPATGWTRRYRHRLS
jgi:peptide/nickel transport system permease protein